MKSLVKISKDMKVLYVEDDQEICKQTLKMLKNFFSDISVSKNGKDGLKKFKNNSYDLIFADLEMPVMHGTEMIESMRKIDSKVPIVVFSAHGKTEYFLKTIESGISGYVLKPYDFKQIKKVISKIINKSNPTVKSKETIELAENFIWNKNKKSLKKDDKLIKLTKNEIKLLEILTIYMDVFTNSEKIETYIFGYDAEKNKSIRNLISRLRKKLGTNLIESNYGQGYRLKKK